MSGEKRPYRKRRRAELEAETRRRITESAMELHGTVGPARTTIGAIAERAGVRRSTVYRHFADEDALFDACSSHFRAANPLPDLERWAAIADSGERVRAALEELYAYYGRTERMLENLYRDEDAVRSLARTFAAFHAYLEAARETLMRGRRGGRPVRAAVGHALAFSTWRSLVREQGLSERKSVELMCRMVDAARGPAVTS